MFTIINDVSELENKSMQELCDIISSTYPVMRKLMKPKSNPDEQSSFSVTGNGRIQWTRPGILRHTTWDDYYNKKQAIALIQRWNTLITERNAEVQAEEQRRQAIIARRNNATNVEVSVTVTFAVAADDRDHAVDLALLAVQGCHRFADEDRIDVGITECKVTHVEDYVEGEVV